jgi:hypothetical protein
MLMRREASVFWIINLFKYFTNLWWGGWDFMLQWAGSVKTGIQLPLEVTGNEYSESYFKLSF